MQIVLAIFDTLKGMFRWMLLPGWVQAVGALMVVIYCDLFVEIYNFRGTVIPQFSTRVEALTTMVAAQWNNELYIVFGSRRLKALQDACSRGMRTMRVDCIVHDLCDNKLGELKAAFLCKFSLAMSTDQHGIVCPSPVARSWSSSDWTRTISRRHPSSWEAWCNIRIASCTS